MDPNLLRACTQCLLETADFTRNRTAAVTSTMQTTTTTTSSSTTVQPQPNTTTVRSEHNWLLGYRPPAPSRAPQNPHANSRGTRCSPYTNAAIACASSTWSRSFVCMATARQQTPLSTSTELTYHWTALGEEKKLSFPKEGNMAEVHKTILVAFPFLINDLTIYLNRIYVKSKTSRNGNIKSQSSRKIRNTTVLSEFSMFLKLSNLSSKIFLRLILFTLFTANG